MPTAKGLITLHEEILAAAGKSRFYVSAQTGHGFGSYVEGQEPNEQPSLYKDANAWFESEWRTSETFVEWQFTRDDPRAGVTANQVTRQPGFRYDPYQTDLEDGMTVGEVCTTYNLPCAP